MRNVPYILMDGIKFALMVLSFDELPSDERPPRRIWENGKALTEWFDDVKKRRDEQYGKSGKGPIEDPVDNAAAAHLIVE